MRPVSGAGSNAGRTAGFTAVEAMVVVAIIAVLAGVGMPAMADFLVARKAAAAADFYRDGLTMARNQALAHNSASRLVLSTNPDNGQLDWRVDLCFPTGASHCTGSSDNWSSATAAADDDPDGASGFRSVTRSAGGLPGLDAISVTAAPGDAGAVYFRPLGWVDTLVSPYVTRITVAPAAARANAFRPMAVALTLAGVASRCDPSAVAPDVRACP